MASTKRSSGRLTPTQARAARRARRTRRKRMLRLGGVSLLGVVGAALIVGLFLPGLPIGFFGGGGGTGPDGPGERIAEAGRGHISPGQGHDPYNSVPATSGPHFGGEFGAPVAWRIYDEPLDPEQYVHNLEHGGIGIFYDCPEGCPDIVSELTDLVEEGRSGGAKILMAPHPDMDTRISLAAWTFLDQFDVFDESRVRAFVSAHESSPNAPEPTAR